jgi:hypothetical protein
MHDGAQAHFSHAVRDALNNTYYDQCIGRRGLTAWPPSSPDLNPLNFYQWGHLKTLMHAAPFDNEEAPCNYPSIFKWMRQSMMKSVEVCTEFHGGHFDHLL